MGKFANLFLVLVWLSCSALATQEPLMGDDQDAQQEEQNQPPRQRTKMAPEAQRVTLESVSAECFDSVYSVLNGDAEQSTLSEECLKEMNEGYNKSPMGMLQTKEQMSSQTAAILRLSGLCRAEFVRASQPKEGEEATQPSEACIEEFQKHYRDMQQWIASSTLSRLSTECRKEVSSGNVGAECEAEFVAIKPQLIQTLDTQNEQKAKEPPKAEKKKSNTTAQAKPKKVKPTPPLIDPTVLFAAFWSLLISGTIAYTCFHYHQNPQLATPVVVVEQVEPVVKSKTQMKKEAREKARVTRRS